MAIGNNGGSNYLSRTANLPGLSTSLTICGWWEFTQTTGTQGIYWAGGGSTDYVYIYQTGNQLKVEGKFGGGATLRSVTSTTTFSTGDIVWFCARLATSGTMQFYTSKGATVTSEGTATWGTGSTNPTSCSVLTKNSGSDLANGYLHSLKVFQAAFDTYRITLEPSFGAFSQLYSAPPLGIWPFFSPSDLGDVGGYGAGSWTVTGTLLQSAKSSPWSIAPPMPIVMPKTGVLGSIVPGLGSGTGALADANALASTGGGSASAAADPTSAVAGGSTGAGIGVGVGGLTGSQALAGVSAGSGSATAAPTEASAISGASFGSGSATAAATEAIALAAECDGTVQTRGKPTLALATGAVGSGASSSAAAPTTAQPIGVAGAGSSIGFGATTLAVPIGSATSGFGAVSGAVAQIVSLAAVCVAMAVPSTAALSVSSAADPVLGSAVSGSASGVAQITVAQAQAAKASGTVDARGKLTIAQAARSTASGSGSGRGSPTQATAARAVGFGFGSGFGHLTAPVGQEIGSPVVAGKSSATAALGTSNALGGVAQGHSRFLYVPGGRGLRRPKIVELGSFSFVSSTISKAQLSTTVSGVVEELTTGGGGGGGNAPSADELIEIAGTSSGTGQCYTALVMAGVGTGIAGLDCRPQLSVALVAFGGGSSGSDCELSSTATAVLGASVAGTSSVIADNTLAVALGAYCSGSSSGLVNFPGIALGAVGGGSGAGVAKLTVSESAQAFGSGSSSGSAAIAEQIALGGVGMGLASFEVDSGESGTASIQLKPCKSICWDRATLRAYISCPDYMPAVVFEYRIVGAPSWTFGKRIAKCAHWRFTNYYAEVTGLSSSQNYEYRVTVLDVRTGTKTNSSINTSTQTQPFTTRPASDATQWGNRKNGSGVTQATYALPGDPTSGLITKTNPRQEVSLIQRAGGSFPFDFVVFGDDNPSGKTRGTVWSYDLAGNPNTVAIVTANSSTDKFANASNTLMNGQPVRFSSTGTLPVGISSSITYYVVNRTGSDFQVSTVIDGSPLNFSTNGTGSLACTVQALLMADHYVARAGTALGLIGSQIGLEGFDGTVATYTAPELALLDSTGGPNGTGYRPRYRDSSSWGCVIGGSSASVGNKDLAWSTTVPVNGLTIVGADLTQIDFLANYSATDNDSFVAGDPVFACSFDAQFGGATNVYLTNLKWGSSAGNVARLGGVGQTVGTSQDTGSTRPTGLIGFYGVEFRAFGENWAGLGSTVSNEHGTGTRTHFRAFGDCRIDARDCVAAWSTEHWFYTNGIGTALSGIDDCFFLRLGMRSGLAGWSNPNGGFTRQPLQFETRAQPDAFKLSLAGAPGVGAFHTYHRALVNGVDFDATHGVQVDWVDGAPSESEVWIEDSTIDGQVLTSTGTLTVSVGSNTFTASGSISIPENTPGSIVSGGASIPAPLDGEHTYFAVNVTNGGKTFQLADRPTTIVGWQLVTITSTGSGSISFQTNDNIGAASTVDGANPIISYGHLGTIHLTNVNLGRGISLDVITNSTKGHYVYEAPDGKRYANKAIHVHSATVTGTRTYSNAAVDVVSCFDVQVDSLDNRTGSRRAISLNDDFSDGMNGNGNPLYGPTDDGDVLDENGQFHCGQASGSALWGSQPKIVWTLNNPGAGVTYTNTQVDHCVASTIVRDLVGSAALGTFPNP